MMTLLGLLASSLRVKRALQWWYQRQAIQLHCEAESIRDGLLQESLTMRRRLELSLEDRIEMSEQMGQDWLSKIEEFHSALEQLSNRLSPPYIEDSLPLAIQYLLQSWTTHNPKLNFETELPANWRQESPERSRIVLIALNEFLQIILSDVLTEASIHVHLKLQGYMAELKIETPCIYSPLLVSERGLKNLEYLSQAFRFLLSGQCFRQHQGGMEAWYFRWGIQDEQFSGLIVNNK